MANMMMASNTHAPATGTAIYNGFMVFRRDCCCGLYILALPEFLPPFCRVSVLYWT